VGWRSSRTREEPARSLWLAGISTLPGGLFFSVLLGGTVTLLAQAAGLTDRQLGVLVALPFATSLIQIPASYAMERAGRRRQIFVWSAFASRTLWLPMSLLPLILGPGRPASQWLLGLAVAINLLGNIAVPAWQSWMADLAPPAIRGAYFAWRGRLFNFSMLTGSLLVALTLPRRADDPRLPWTLAAIFAAGIAAGLWEIRFYRGVMDAPRHDVPRSGWRVFVIPLRNRDFRMFLGFNFLSMAGVAILGPFLWKHFLSELQMGGFRTTLMLQTSPLLAAALVGPLLGRGLDRLGAKPLLQVGLWGGAATTLGWFFIRAEFWWAGMLLAGFGQLFWTAVDQANFVLLMRYSSRRDGAPPAVYATVFNLVVALAGALAGALGGDLAERLRQAEWVARWGAWMAPLPFSPYLPLLLLSTALRVAAGEIFGRRLADAGAASTGTAFRHMTHLLYVGMQISVWRPLRDTLLPYHSRIRRIFPGAVSTAGGKR